MDLGWFGFVSIFVLGLVLMGLTYGMYRDSAWEDEMSEYSPVVCMEIIGRVRGAGTVKLPDEIHARYQNKTYQLNMGRKYFRSLSGVDTIAVYFDAASGRVVLPTSGKVRHYAFMYLMIGGIGLCFVVGGVLEMKRWIRRKRGQNE